MPVLPNSLRVRLARAHEILSDGSRPPPAIATLANDLAMSRAHFMRRFRGVYGESALQVSMRERMRRARLMLASGDRSVTEICLLLGYSSPTTFSMLFNRHAGESPSCYRRRFWAVRGLSDDVQQILQPGCMNLLTMAWSSTSGHFSRRAAFPAVADLPNDKPDPEKA